MHSRKCNNENIIIIENEFGQVGIDGGLLRKTNIEVSTFRLLTLEDNFDKFKSKKVRITVFVHKDPSTNKDEKTVEINVERNQKLGSQYSYP